MHVILLNDVHVLYADVIGKTCLFATSCPPHIDVTYNSPCNVDISFVATLSCLQFIIITFFC
jgi:hypothetical protein